MTSSIVLPTVRADRSSIRLTFCTAPLNREDAPDGDDCAFKESVVMKALQKRATVMDIRYFMDLFPCEKRNLGWLPPRTCCHGTNWLRSPIFYYIKRLFSEGFRLLTENRQYLKIAHGAVIDSGIMPIIQLILAWVLFVFDIL